MTHFAPSVHTQHAEGEPVERLLVPSQALVEILQPDLQFHRPGQLRHQCAKNGNLVAVEPAGGVPAEQADVAGRGTIIGDRAAQRIANVLGRGLFEKTAGLLPTLRRVLKPFQARIDCAFVYGSVARSQEYALSVVGPAPCRPGGRGKPPALAVLKRFRPTKIAIEAEVGSKRVEQEYGDYLAGKYTLSANETNQIGYRLAKELGHPAVFPVDVDGDFPWLRLANYAKANGRAAQLDAISAGWGALVKELGEFLPSHTVLEALELVNSDSRAARDVGLYFATVRFAEPFEYAGPDLLAAYYQRNIRIYSNIVRLITSPNDRILVVYGYGHLGWLRPNVVNDPAVRLRTLADLTGKR